MSKNEIVWCDQGWWRGLFYYGFCPNKKVWDKQLKKFDVSEDYPTSAGGCSFLVNKEGKRCCVVTIRDELETSYSALEISCLLVHEAVHVWQELCDVIGETTPSNEFEAYSIQAISQELIHGFEQTRRKLKDCGK